jgi:2-succinyl-5-enolpyruvyl-6-hydroxy-3-cyclohexene-1-carboxylate synthase
LLAAAADGPVHLNAAMVEPLDASPSEVPAGRDDGAPWRAAPQRDEALGGTSRPADRAILVAGRSTWPGGGDEIDAVPAWPLLADPLSGVRDARFGAIASFDLLLRDEGLAGALRPDAVVLTGGHPASRALAEAVKAWDLPVTVVTDARRVEDPIGVVAEVVHARPATWLRDQAKRGVGDESFRGRWVAADRAVQAYLDTALASDWSEPAIGRAIERFVPPDVAVVVSSSMPVRDLEWFGAAGEARRAVLANRGANGIDGVVSTALGAAVGDCAVAVIGDLAFLHDAGSLADGTGAAGGTCVLVVLDNRGGGIFSFLPQRASVPVDDFELLFGTPPRVDVASVAAGYGAPTTEVRDLGALHDAIDRSLAAPGVHVVVARLADRDDNVVRHRELFEGAAVAARSALGR